MIHAVKESHPRQLYPRPAPGTRGKLLHSLCRKSAWLAACKRANRLPRRIPATSLRSLPCRARAVPAEHLTMVTPEEAADWERVMLQRVVEMMKFTDKFISYIAGDKGEAGSALIGSGTFVDL